MYGSVGGDRLDGSEELSTSLLLSGVIAAFVIYK